MYRPKQEQGRLQRKVHKSKADEALMLRAVQELRKKMVEDQRQLHSAAQRVQVWCVVCGVLGSVF